MQKRDRRKTQLHHPSLNDPFGSQPGLCTFLVESLNCMPIHAVFHKSRFLYASRQVTVLHTFVARGEKRYISCRFVLDLFWMESSSSEWKYVHTDAGQIHMSILHVLFRCVHMCAFRSHFASKAPLISACMRTHPCSMVSKLRLRRRVDTAIPTPSGGGSVSVCVAEQVTSIVSEVLRGQIALGCLSERPSSCRARVFSSSRATLKSKGSHRQRGCNFGGSDR